MPDKHVLRDWVREALSALGGRAKLVEVAKEIWSQHENDLINSHDLFYTWQYDMRWAATELRREGIMKSTQISQEGVWELQ